MTKRQIYRELAIIAFLLFLLGAALLIAPYVHAQDLPEGLTPCAIGGYWIDDTQMIVDTLPGFQLTQPEKTVSNSKGAKNDTTELGEALYGELMKIPGVRGVVMVQYQLGVSKWRLFNWQDIEPQVLKTLESVAKQNAKSK